MILRNYQEECQAKIKEKGPGRWLIVMATGLGKTATFASLPSMGKTLIIAHTKELVKQPASYFSIPVGIEMGEEKSNGEDVVIASMQSLKNRLEKFKPDYFDRIIVDEAHHAVSNTYSQVINYFKPRQLLGFTATPNRADDVGLESIFDEIIFERNLEFAIKNKYLSNLKCKRIDIGFDLSNIATRLGDFSQKELEKAINIQGANHKIIEIIHDQAINPCIVFCVSIKHAEDLQKSIQKSEVIIGKTKNRDEILSRFRSGDTEVLLSVGVLTEGVDLPMTMSVVVARPTQSTALYTQMIGRALRLFKGKTEALVIDCVGNTGNHSLCTASSLLGYDLELMTQKQTETLEGDLFDLPDKINKLMDSPESFIKNETYVKLFRKKHKLNSHDLAFTLMPNGELILSIDQNRWIGIETVDLTGHTRIISSFRPVGEKRKAQAAIDIIFSWMKQEFKSTLTLYRMSAIKRWSRGRNPTSRQIGYCTGLLRQNGMTYNLRTATMLEINTIIARLKVRTKR